MLRVVAGVCGGAKTPKKGVAEGGMEDSASRWSCSAAAWLTAGEGWPPKGVAGGANVGVGGTRDRSRRGRCLGVSTSALSLSSDDSVRLDASLSFAESELAT
jgi:hypothetical protein